MKYLYHILNVESLFHNLKCNCIKGDHYNGVSLTRTKFLNGYVGERYGAFFKLELDYQKLKQDYKLKNTIFVSKTGVSFDDEKEVHINEPINNLSKYLTKIILIKNKVEYLKNNNWFSTIGIRPISGFKNAPEIIRFIYKKYRNIFYIQDESNIEKINYKYILDLFNYIRTIFTGYAFYYRGYEKIYDNPNFKNLSSYKERVIPLDNYNTNIDKLVIGYDYNNLRLFKNKKYSLIKSLKLDKINQKFQNYDLYCFQFTYIPQDIIKNDDKMVIIKQGYLEDADPVRYKIKE